MRRLSRVRRARFGTASKRCTQLRVALDMDRALLRKQHDKIDTLECVVETVKRCLGQYFIGLNPHELSSALEEAFLSDCLYFGTGRGFETHQLMALRIDRRRFESQLHVRVRLGDGLSGYAISKEALMETPADVLTRHIANAIAVNLIAAIRQTRPQGHNRRA